MRPARHWRFFGLRLSHPNTFGQYLYKGFQYPIDSLDFPHSQDALSAARTGTIDVVPGINEVLFKEGLNYSLRPVPHSYLSNASKLDIDNANHIATNGPRFILFNSGSVDNRYPLFDEPATKIEILKNYRTKYISRNGSVVVLERLEKPVTFKSTFLSGEEINFDQVIPLETTDEIQIANIVVDYSWMGQIFSFLFWTPELNVTFTLPDNSTRTFKCVKSLCENGIIINKFIGPGGSKEFSLLVDYLGMLNQNVKTVQFSSKSSWAFKNSLEVSINTLQFDEGKGALSNEFKPVIIGPMDKNVKGEVRVNFERFTVDKEG